MILKHIALLNLSYLFVERYIANKFRTNCN